ncbi:MAG: M20/M25/M40 family metallo-hydrolase [Oscillospiraceae bacterium]|nr:M20/M25/M40 family metallo-hydrolase [Oscillospiraceae bacterium]
MIGWIILAALCLLVIVLLVRTLMFTPKEGPRSEGEAVKFDKEKAVEHMQEFIRCKTVSYADWSLVDEEQFSRLRALLPQFYPHVFGACTFERVDRTAMLFHWKGKSSDAPVVLMAHYDVVPADEAAWQRPAFEGLVEDGVLWGRGTLDTKVTFCAALEAAEKLIADGFVPQNDIYFSFSGDEEVAGNGAPAVVELLRSRGITPALVVDEGGAVVQDVFPGVKGRIAVVGIAEKGMMQAQLRLKSNGGHASAPPASSPVGRLAKAVCNIEKHPFPAKLSGATGYMFDTLGRHSGFALRMVFANLWLFAPVIDLLGRKKGGEINALLRTTCAFTQMQGSDANNVLPPFASVSANLRLNPGETADSAAAYLRSLIKDKDIELVNTGSMNPSPCSEIDNEGWQKLRTAIEQTWTDAVVSPYLMMACSDSRHFCAISDKVMRFSAMELSGEERALIHANDERIPLEKIHKAVEFYIRLEGLC